METAVFLPFLPLYAKRAGPRRSSRGTYAHSGSRSLRRTPLRRTGEPARTGWWHGLSVPRSTMVRVRSVKRFSSTSAP
ncbi:hypothetical protein S1361_28975 [Streptomyces cyanogenus]|uniref:Uncharacterized protein n=1 Tax=Streptomyces cyanogenus TaxID=80860 RepID=A0ABX7TX83_STRCY|nr:hypothetical protein S1361_28975 [Streptomyces cyanogenus]